MISQRKTITSFSRLEEVFHGFSWFFLVVLLRFFHYDGFVPTYILEFGNMQSVARYRVCSPFLAVRPSPNKERFVTLPVGAVIETSEDLLEPGLGSVIVNGDNLLAFHRDIVERTEPVDDWLAKRA